MHIVLRRAVLALAFLPTLGWAGTWEIDSAHTNVWFTVRHMMVSNVRGEFTSVSGTIELDEKNLTKSSIDATIDATTINTRVAKRDEHLKAADFLDVQKFPTITFKSKKVAAGKGKGRYKVTGDLTLRGVTKEVVLDVDASSGEIKDPFGMLRRGATATTRLNRKDFGLSYNRALEGGGLVIGDEVNVTIDIELTPKAKAVEAPKPETPKPEAAKAEEK